jgi:hypothetical protein
MLTGEIAVKTAGVLIYPARDRRKNWLYHAVIGILKSRAACA